MFNLEVLQKVMAENNIPTDAKIYFDGGMDMGVFGVTHIYYNETTNVLILTTYAPYAGTYMGSDRPFAYELIRAEDLFDPFLYDESKGLTWEELYKNSDGLCCSYCSKKGSCTDEDKAECLRKFNDKDGYYEVEFESAGEMVRGWTKWKLIWENK